MRQGMWKGDPNCVHDWLRSPAVETSPEGSSEYFYVALCSKCSGIVEQPMTAEQIKEHFGDPPRDALDRG